MSTVLVMEDHEENRRILRAPPASACYEMLEAAPGEEGWSWPRRTRPLS